MTTLIEMINFVSLFESRNPRVQALFFHQALGLAEPQKGHDDSEELINFLQLGQRIDCLWLLIGFFNQFHSVFQFRNYLCGPLNHKRPLL
jgi:hypothetical protein